jgi:hypothetical protein
MVADTGNPHGFLVENLDQGAEFFPVGGFAGRLESQSAHPRFTASAAIPEVEGEDAGVRWLGFPRQTRLEAREPPIHLVQRRTGKVHLIEIHGIMPAESGINSPMQIGVKGA